MPVLGLASDMRTHYEVLGIRANATAEEVRAAFRQLALEHHPDRSQAPGAAARFAAVVEAYDVLRDDDARKAYDSSLRPPAEGKRPEAPKAAPPKPKHKPSAPSAEADRIAVLFSRGDFAAAERLAKSVLAANPREAIAYAVLGDIARARGELNHAANLYAHAAQMDPRNAGYQRKYEEMAGRSQVAARQPDSSLNVGVLAGFAVPLLGAMYLALSKEPLAIGPWTLGALAMVIVSGISVGVALCAGKVLDRFEPITRSARGTMTPAGWVMVLSLFSFWLAAAVYAAIGFRGSFVQAVTRSLAAVAAIVLLLAMGAGASSVQSPAPLLLWGGSLAAASLYAGWLVTDALRGP